MNADKSTQREPGGNVCLGASAPQQINSSLFPFQFVYETLPAALRFPEFLRYHRCCLIAEGASVLTAGGARHTVSAGDLVFLRPSLSYSFTGIRGLKFFYITFTGLDMDTFLAEYGITEDAQVFSGFSPMIEQWMQALSVCNDNNLPTLTKGLLYYALALLMNEPRDASPPGDGVICRIRSFIDDSYGNSSLSLAYVCRLYNYHPNYISRRFREATGVSFSEYLEACRIKHARQLLAETDLPVRIIASGVGYQSAMYFSKVFKKVTGETPTGYRSRRTG